MLEVIFLFVFGLIWITFASIQDLRKREVANWLNFSLIIFVLGFRFFWSLFSGDWNFLFQGLIGLGIFFIIGNLLYYGKLFAGGDAKLMIALGAVLPFSDNFFTNMKIFFFFIFLFLLNGAVDGILSAVFFSLKNWGEFKLGFKKTWKNHKKFTYLIMILGLIIMILGFFQGFLLYLGILIFAFPYLYLYAKAVDESCMIRKVKVRDLAEGD
jgi:Flp pilus assembly protein protease CpaA